MENEYKTVKEIAEIFKVTPSGVRFWLSKGLNFKIEKVIGVKPRKIIKVEDVKNFLNLTRR